MSNVHELKMTRKDWLRTLSLEEITKHIETFPGDECGCEDEISEAFDALDRACAKKRDWEEENPEDDGYEFERLTMRDVL